MKCSICNSEFEGFGNNSDPIVPGTCCDKCNSQVVMPIRMFLAGMIKRHVLVVGSDLTLKILKPNQEEIGLTALQELVEGYVEIYPKEDDKNCCNMRSPRHQILIRQDVAGRTRTYRL